MATRNGNTAEELFGEALFNPEFGRTFTAEDAAKMQYSDCIKAAVKQCLDGAVTDIAPDFMQALCLRARELVVESKGNRMTTRGEVPDEFYFRGFREYLVSQSSICRSITHEELVMTLAGLVA